MKVYRGQQVCEVDAPLFDRVERFDGRTFDLARDGARLTRLLDRVRAVLGDGRDHTLAALAEATGGTEASVSARIRDLRKPRFGGHTIERHYVERGLWVYRWVR